MAGRSIWGRDIQADSISATLTIHRHTYKAMLLHMDFPCVSFLKGKQMTIKRIINKETKAEFLNKRIEKQANIIINLAKERDTADKILDSMAEELMVRSFEEEEEKPDDGSIVADRVLGDLELATPGELEYQVRLKEAEVFQDLDLQILAKRLKEIEQNEKLKKEPVLQDDFINESKLEFTDISSEQYRIYEFNNGKTIMIAEPLRLNISKSGGHRLYDSSGVSHYIPQGWVRVSWKSKPNQPNFVK